MDASLAVTLWCFCLKFSREKGKARKMIAPTVLLVKSLPYHPTSDAIYVEFREGKIRHTQHLLYSNKHYQLLVVDFRLFKYWELDR